MIGTMIDQMRRFRSGSALKVANAATSNNTLAAAVIGGDTTYPLTPPYAGTASNGGASTTVTVALRTGERLHVGQTVSFAKSDWSSVLDRTVTAVGSDTSITVNSNADLSSGTWHVYRRGDTYGKRIKVAGLTLSTPVAGWARFYSGIGNALPATFTKIGECYMPATTKESGGNKLDMVGVPGCPIFCVFTADSAVALSGSIDAALNVEGRYIVESDSPGGWS